MNNIINSINTDWPRADVWLHGRRVARLYRQGRAKHWLQYESGAGPEDFVSLLLPVRAKPYEWPELHPFFQMNLPEGAQLDLIKKVVGPRLDGTDLTLLSLIGARGIGRVQVVPADQEPQTPPERFDLRRVLKGDNSEEAFKELMRDHVVSAVSGVMPKFLSSSVSESGMESFHKASLITPHAIVKGSSTEFPYLALNEHLSMAVARRAGLPTPETQLSDDGLALVVARFDIDEGGAPRGLEDMCSLLGLRPAEKYDTTWEKIDHVVKRLVPASRRIAELERLMRYIVLHHAIRNADCHSKNVALLYSSRDDVGLAPVYDVVTTVAYTGYRNSPPGLSLAGRKTWQPGRSLQHYASTRCNLPPRRYQEIVETTCRAVAETMPDVLAAIDRHPGFREIGKRILQAWREGVAELGGAARAGADPLRHIDRQLESARMSDPASEPRPERIGRSELLGRRG